MTFQEFRASLTNATPPAELTTALQALWQAGKGDWNTAHTLVQSGEGQSTCDWVHAHLHRQEGDLNNAGYWYRRAGKPVADASLEEEWTVIARSLLSG
jgi:hypothetical protein